jgi:hypothetical protein
MKSPDNERAFIRQFLAEETESRPAPSPTKEPETERLWKGLHEFGQWARGETERSDDFWRHQQAAIRSRIPMRSGGAFGASMQAWAALAAVVIVGISLLTVGQAPAPAPAAAQVDVDHELLLAVERDVRSEVPTALQPATLLAQEINDGMQSHAVNSHSSKEKAHED